VYLHPTEVPMIFRSPFPEMTLPDISLTSYIYALDMSFVAERVTPCKRLRDVAFVAQMP
jgi:hypothetical protein